MDFLNKLIHNTRIFYTNIRLRNMRILKIEFGKKVKYKAIVNLFFTTQ